MKLGWFGLFPLYQVNITKKENRKVEKIHKSSELNKENEKDSYSFTNKNKS